MSAEFQTPAAVPSPPTPLLAANGGAAACSPANGRPAGVGGGGYKSPTRGSPGTRGGWKAPLCLTLIGGIDGGCRRAPSARPLFYSLTFSGRGEPPQGEAGGGRGPGRRGGGGEGGEGKSNGPKEAPRPKKKTSARGPLAPIRPGVPARVAAVGRHPPLPPRRVRLCQPRRRAGGAARGSAPPAEQTGAAPPGKPPRSPAPWGARTASLRHARPRASGRWGRWAPRGDPRGRPAPRWAGGRAGSARRCGPPGVSRTAAGPGRSFVTWGGGRPRVVTGRRAVSRLGARSAEVNTRERTRERTREHAGARRGTFGEGVERADREGAARGGRPAPYAEPCPAAWGRGGTKGGTDKRRPCGWRWERRDASARHVREAAAICWARLRFYPVPHEGSVNLGA